MENVKNGFTLIECVICLALISLFAMVAVPSLSAMQDRLQFRSELSTLVSSLQQAKIAAISSNSFVVFQVQAQGYIVFIDNGAGGGVMGDWIQQGQEKVIHQCKLPANFVLQTNLTLGRTRFRGHPGMKAGTIKLRNTSGLEANVAIDTVGRIRS